MSDGKGGASTQEPKGHTGPRTVLNQLPQSAVHPSGPHPLSVWTLPTRRAPDDGLPVFFSLPSGTLCIFLVHKATPPLPVLFPQGLASSYSRSSSPITCSLIK